MSNKKQNETVSTKVIAELFDVTERQVQSLVQEGVIHAERDARNNYIYNLSDTIKEYIKHLKAKAFEKPKSKSMQEKEEEKLDAEIEFKQAKAKAATLMSQELQSQMHRSEDVEEAVNDLVYAIRSALLALPGRLAVEMAKIESATVASERIEKEVKEMLMELSTHEYDPKQYRERVRERQGWQNEKDEE